MDGVRVSGRGLPQCRVKESTLAEDEGVPQKVSELMMSRMWNVEVLQKLFSPDECDAIQCIPLPKFSTNDEWMWCHTTHGKFTVRNAYFIELTSVRSSQPSASVRTSRKVWKMIWGANVPQKVKMFGWRLLNNGLPINQNLANRGMAVNRVCQRCRDKAETVEHMIMKCEESIRVWYGSPLRLETDKIQAGTVRDWVEMQLAREREDEWWAMFWFLCWNIWLSRNVWAFERKKISFTEMVSRAVGEPWNSTW